MVDPIASVRERMADGIVLVTLARPPVNALDNASLRTLCELFERVAVEPQVRGVILTGEGSRFCAGGDFKELRGFGRERGVERVRLAHRLLVALDRLDRPFACAINGDAVGGGCEFCVFADHRVALSTARFGMPEINNGLLPMAKGMQQLVRILGPRTARRLLFTGELITAREARDLGIVDALAEPGELLERAHAWTRAAAAKSPRLFAAMKRTVRGTGQLSDEDLERVTIEDFETYFRPLDVEPPKTDSA